MSLKIYSKIHKKTVSVTALMDPSQVKYGKPSKASLAYPVGTGAPSAYKNHNGLDLAGADGSELYCPFDGVVRVNSYEAGGAGHYVSIGLDGVPLRTMQLMHMKTKSRLKVGDRIKAGDLIGYQGSTGRSTGSHVHVGFSIDGKRADPFDLVIGQNEVTLMATTGKYKITANNLNIRDKPDTSGAVRGKYNSGDTVDIYGLSVDAVSGAWGAIKSGDSFLWICIQTPAGEAYAARIGELPTPDAPDMQEVLNLRGEVTRLRAGITTIISDLGRLVK